MIQLVKEFTQFAQNIDKHLENSNYKTKYFIEGLDLSKPTFYRKLREHAFSVKEIEKLAELLYPQDFYEWKILNNKRKSREELTIGSVKNAREDLKELREKYQNNKGIFCYSKQKK